MRPISVEISGKWLEVTTRVYPYFEKRTTIYLMAEFRKYIQDTHWSDKQTFDLDFFMENFDDVIFLQIEEFHYHALNLHEKSNSLRLQGKLDAAYRQIQRLKNRIINLINK
jgi:hypothetical protein